jgi:hypothetical protein
VNRLRLLFALLGFLLALLSVALDDIRLGWAAVAVLLISLIARLILRRKASGKSSDGEPL